MEKEKSKKFENQKVIPEKRIWGRGAIKKSKRQKGGEEFLGNKPLFLIKPVKTDSSNSGQHEILIQLEHSLHHNPDNWTNKKEDEMTWTIGGHERHTCSSYQN